MALTVYAGCNNCGKEMGPFDAEDAIPVGHLCSDECVKAWADKVDAATLAGVSVFSDPPQDGPPKFYTPPVDDPPVAETE